MSKILDKISKVLNQAENASTPEEAAAFMEMAQKMASMHAIDLAVARQQTAKREQREQPVQKRVTLGTAGQRSLKDYVSLFCAITRANDIKINIAHNSVYVILFGMPSDIEVAEALFNSLVVQMVSSSEEYLASGEYKKETYLAQVRVRNAWGFHETDYVEKTMDGRVARRNFYEGFVYSIGDRLNKARKEAIAESVAVEVESTGTELVLAAKTAEVESFYSSTSNARGSYRGRSGGAYSSSSRSAGHSAGSNARLSSQGSLAGARQALGA